MLPRQHTSSAIFVSVTCFWLVTALLTGCDATTKAEGVPSPATNVPHGTIELAQNAATITPRARAVSALKTNAEAAGHRFHLLEADGSPLAALIDIDLQQHQPILLTEPKGIRPNKAIEDPAISVVVGSGFVSLVHDMQPIGLLQFEGELRNGIEQHGYTRILGITADLAAADPSSRATTSRFKVVHRSEWQPDLFRSALQAGPGIVEQGKLDISDSDLQRQKYFRSFVVECGDRAITGISLVPTHLYTLGAALVELFARENMQCNEVVNLAGDREAVLLTSTATQAAYLGDPQPRKAALIGFRARAN